MIMDSQKIRRPYSKRANMVNIYDIKIPVLRYCILKKLPGNRIKFMTYNEAGNGYRVVFPYVLQKILSRFGKRYHLADGL